ncbi:hypothetical protein DAEQUDRAFT_239273 [Daedalea quercina L-15889]|uniref:Uncharacterized protein n=1 Tax=Daedalea quercina L-15889 TaxID=1314783 RepID=A0A165QQ64_9APHY|nr:hypothetical protein DAEQUDRAFT_239273 [Daedalea quercina L-15889]
MEPSALTSISVTLVTALVSDRVSASGVDLTGAGASLSNLSPAASISAFIFSRSSRRMSLPSEDSVKEVSPERNDPPKLGIRTGLPSSRHLSQPCAAFTPCRFMSISRSSWRRSSRRTSSTSRGSKGRPMISLPKSSTGSRMRTQPSLVRRWRLMCRQESSVQPHCRASSSGNSGWGPMSDSERASLALLCRVGASATITEELGSPTSSADDFGDLCDLCVAEHGETTSEPSGVPLGYQ